MTEYNTEKTVCPFCSSEWVTAQQHDRKVDRLEQEPVARVVEVHATKAPTIQAIAGREHQLRVGDFLYTTPPQRKPLTDEETIILKGKTCPEIDWKARHGVEMNNGERNQWMLDWFMAFKVAIEAAHGIKE